MAEVMDCFDFNQLQPNQSQDQCGFASVALCFAAGQPGHGPRQPVQWAIERMAAWYTEFDGPNILSNKKGMETWQLYKLIVEKGGHYQEISANADSIASWIDARYPVIVAVTEDSVYDVHLKAKPYAWDTSGLSHIFTVTGIDHDHIFLCRDTVNQHDGSPYSYDGDKLSYLSATVFVPDWLPRPTSAIAPQGEDMPKVISIHDVAGEFDELDKDHWRSKKTGKIIQYGLLGDYKAYTGNALCGFTYLGHPISPEIEIGTNKAKQHYQFGVRCWDNGKTYSLDLYAPGSPGQDPGLALLQAEVAQLKQGQAVDPLASQALIVVRQVKPLFQPF